MLMDIRYMILVYLIRCKIYSILYTRIYEFLDVYELFVERSSFNICCVFLYSLVPPRSKAANN
jgi:hypothetical protein